MTGRVFVTHVVFWPASVVPCNRPSEAREYQTLVL